MAADGNARTSETVAERRQLTVLFCDLVNSAAMSERLDPEDWRDILQRYQTGCADIVRRYEGYVAQYLGDGLLVYFGYPFAHEDSPHRAVRAGLAIVEIVPGLNTEVGARSGVALQVRVGIHTGPVVVGSMGDAQRRELLAVGETPNVAARAQGEARSNSVVVSEATCRLIAGYFTFNELGAFSLKGFSHATTLYEVVGQTDVRNRLDISAWDRLTPFVGREKETAFVEARWDDTLKGKACVVTLSGEPGIGKSRLVRTLRQKLKRERSLTLECYGSPLFQGTALHPITEMIETHLGFTRETSPEQKLELLRSELARVGVDMPEAMPLLAATLSIPVDESAAPRGLSPQKRRQLTFDALVAWLHALTTQGPVLFVVEDVHWADASTLEFLARLIDREPPGPLMLFATHRPEFVPPWDSPRLSKLSLLRMTAKEMRQIMQGVLIDESLPKDIEREVLAKADGVPLYVEEITKAVVEARASPPAGVAVSNLGTRAAGAAVTIPATVRDSFTARLDRLGGGKALLQLAATLGRTFPFELLQAVTGIDEGALRSELDRLTEVELLVRRGASSDQYAFKHALIQDAAYASLLRSTRQINHRRVAVALTDRFPEMADAQPELLARHYAGANMPSEAIAKWILSGQQAIARSAYAEALSGFRGALEQLSAIPQSRNRDRLEVELRSTLGTALISTFGYTAPEVEANYRRASELCEQLGDVPPAVLYYIWGVHLVRSDRDSTARFAKLFEEIIETSNSPDILRVAYAGLGGRAFWCGKYSEARHYCNQALAHCNFDENRLLTEAFHATPAFEIYLYMLLYLPWCDEMAGFPQRARRGWDYALEMAQRVRSPFAMAMALGYAAWGERDFGNTRLAKDMAQQQMAISAEHGFPFWLTTGSALVGWAEAREKDFATGVSRIDSALSLLRQIGGFLIYPQLMSSLVEAHLFGGQYAQALAVVNEALAFCEGKLSEHFVPRLLKLRADVLAALHEYDVAEQDYRQSLKVFGDQGAVWFQLQASVGLARLLRETNRSAEARSLLLPIYAFFTEGLELPDVVVARGLLAELS